jgi:hypothetical protein
MSHLLDKEVIITERSSSARQRVCVELPSEFERTHQVQAAR